MNTPTVAHVVPFTPPGALWSQREYVHCTSLRIGFTAHRHNAMHEAFHYHFPGVGCTTVLVSFSGIERRIYHEFAPDTADWIKQCSAATREAVAAAERRERGGLV
jgi:hypothetical protein